MSYAVKDGKVLWKGRAVKGADAGSFEVLAEIIGRDAGAVYVLGKAAKVDAGSFEVLSASYARDAGAVYLIMETKLKPVKQADAASFEAVGARHGCDVKNAFCRDKRMRLSKRGSLEAFRALGHVYASDGATLFFGTDRVAPIEGFDVDWARARLKWFDDNEINLPSIALTDGERVWVKAGGGAGVYDWLEHEGADFETVEPLSSDHPALWRTNYVRDKKRVWFCGVEVPGADPAKAELFGAEILRQCEHLWLRGELMDIAASEAEFVSHYSGRATGEFARGDLLHLGDRLVLYSMLDGVVEFAGSGARPSVQAAAEASLRPLLAEVALVLDKFRPIHWSANAVARWQSAEHNTPEQIFALPEMPEFEITVSEAGEAVLTLADGVELHAPLSAWYSLGCHLWCHMRGVAAEVVPYISVGTMLPRGDSMHIYLSGTQRQAMWQLAGAAFRAGHENEARQLGHLMLWEAMRYTELDDEMMGWLADLPRELVSAFHFAQKHHDFSSTTNLAAARTIVKEDLLADPDFRVRIEMCGVLTGTTISTNKRAHFLKEIAPYVMERYAAETVDVVRERMAAVLEAMLIGGQVDCEVSQRFHHAEMLPVIEFCLEQEINSRFNRARLAEAYWALDREDEGDTVAEALIAEVGEDWVMSGVYAHRPMFRGPRLWFLRGKLDVAWRKSKPEAHRARLVALTGELGDLKARYGADWVGDDVEAVESDLQRYKEGVAQL